MSGDDALLLAELEALEKEERRRNRYSEWCPEHPTVTQQRFLDLNCREALFGGAAGGGKSSAILMSALQYVDEPNYAALVLRKTYKDLALPGAIMDRARTWLQGTRAKWSEASKTWTFPSGSTLTFSHCEHHSDVYRLQGAEFQFIGVDELGQFGSSTYLYLLSRLRRKAGSKIPIRARSASNPGGVAHFFLKERFVDSSDPERVFVPSKLADNKHIDATEYLKALALLDETTRRQLADGIWIQNAAGLVFPHPQTLPCLPAGDYSYLLGVDFGIRDATAYVVIATRPHDRTVYIVEAFKENGTTVTQSAERVLELDTRYKFQKIVGDLGGLGKAFGEEFTRRYSIPIEAAQKANRRGYVGLFNAALERGEIQILKPACDPLLEEMAKLPWADDTKQHTADGFEDHCVDAALYIWRAANAFSQKPLSTPPSDPLEQIRQQTAVFWARHEEERLRHAAQSRADDYDLGSRWIDPEAD